MIVQLSLVALIVIAAAVCIGATGVGVATISFPALAQNMAVGNITGKNLAESLATSESEGGAYNEQGAKVSCHFLF